MKTRKVGRKAKISFTYFEWINSGKTIPQVPEELQIEGIPEYIITDAPEDKKEYFESLGYIVRLNINKSRGMKLTY